MNNILLTLITLSLIFPALSGCRKREGVRTRSMYTFTNETGRRITFDLYDNSVDYGRETNRLERHVLEPGAAQAITLEVGKGYWIDWYGDGHTYNNWESQYSGAHPAAELLPVAETDDARPITVNLPDTTRSVMLNGGTSSAWKGELLSGGSVAGTYEFLLRKDFTGHYTYTSRNGIKTDQPVKYRIYNVHRELGKTSHFAMQIMNEQNKGLFAVYCNLRSFESTGRDTLLVELIGQSNAYRLPAIRQ